MDNPKPPVLRNEKGHFVKGQSGNPTGKSARMVPDGNGGWITPTELFQRGVAPAYDLLTNCIGDTNEKMRDRLFAAKLLLDRALGTPKQTIEVQTDIETDHTVQKALDATAIEDLRSLLNARVIEVDAEILPPDDE